jgi:hypothetical protein
MSKFGLRIVLECPRLVGISRVGLPMLRHCFREQPLHAKAKIARGKSRRVAIANKEST